MAYQSQKTWHICFPASPLPTCHQAPVPSLHSPPGRLHPAPASAAGWHDRCCLHWVPRGWQRLPGQLHVQRAPAPPREIYKGGVRQGSDLCGEASQEALWANREEWWATPRLSWCGCTTGPTSTKCEQVGAQKLT
eukprot:1159774-Pelagomonas_calceolata.AAC.11